MNWPQKLVVVGMIFNVILAMASHGTVRTGRWNAAHNFVAVVALAALLYFGGFFG